MTNTPLQKVRMQTHDPKTGALLSEVDVLTSADAVLFSDGKHLEEVLASGLLKGEKGEKGADGATGINGKSAYELAQDNGFIGTEVEYLASLKGEGWQIATTYPTILAMEADHANETIKEGQLVAISSSENDPDNAKVYMKNATDYSFVFDMSGATGVQGPAGERGLDGKSAYDIAVENGYQGTEAEWTQTQTSGMTMGDAPENAQPVQVFLRVISQQ